MDYTQILIKPLISEKATTMKEVANQIAFYVHPDANKIEIRKAVEKAFGVKVEGVNVVKRRARARPASVARSAPCPASRRRTSRWPKAKRSNCSKESKHGHA